MTITGPLIVRRIGPLSLGKIMGATYGVMGLFFGVVFALVSVAGSALAPQDTPEGPLIGLVFGVGGVVVLPLLYGVFGLVAGALGAFLYNVVAGFVGGVEIDLRDDRT